MPLERIDHDKEDVALLVTGALSPCPFCGGTAITHHGINREPTYARVPIYRSVVSCTDHHCGASLGHNATSLEEARLGAVKRWQTRFQRPQPTRRP